MSLAICEGSSADWPKVGDVIGPFSFGPFDAARLARYAAVSGDDNPLHLDQDVAAAAGLDATPVHGMLLMSCFEPALDAWRSDFSIAQISAKFLRPILAGQGIVICGRVLRATYDGEAELVLRLMARGPDGDLAILAEAKMARPSVGGA